jgi:hypothetical protein
MVRSGRIDLYIKAMKLVLLSRENIARADELNRKAQYIALVSCPEFKDTFI